MYVVTLILPSNINEKPVTFYFVGHVVKDGLAYEDWDEFCEHALLYNSKLAAKVEQSRLRMVLGSERCKVQKINSSEINFKRFGIKNKMNKKKRTEQNN